MQRTLGLLICLFALNLPAETGSDEVSPHALASSASRGCLSAHLEEAMVLNRERRPIYSALSNGGTEHISNLLIQYEQWVWRFLPITGIESAVKKFHQADIPILCADFESTPNPHPATLQSNRPQISDFQPLGWKKAKKALLQSMRQGDFPATYTQALELIKSIDREPRFNCMSRHALESIARISLLAPGYEKSATEMGLTSSPQTISKRLLMLLLKALWGAENLDRQAAPFQVQGIPILCHDLPMIDFLR
jgi:hypothetical protein